MDIIKIYFKDGSSKEIATSSWYHKPSILQSIAFYFWESLFFKNDESSQVLFVTSSCYGCRQFLPKMSKQFPVHCYSEFVYKKDLPWYLFEFNDHALKNSTPENIEFVKNRIKSKVTCPLPF